jgi:hypothetical protein
VVFIRFVFGHAHTCSSLIMETPLPHPVPSKQ